MLVLMDQSEELVTLEPVIGVVLVGRCELLCKPGTPVRVVIDRHNVFYGSDRSEDSKLDRNDNDLRASFELGPACEDPRASVGSNIDVNQNAWAVRCGILLSGSERCEL